jgi:hypothetical protein
MNAPAIFLGFQPGINEHPGVELYNLLAPVGKHPAGSTVSRSTLERHGFKLPPLMETRAAAENMAAG